MINTQRGSVPILLLVIASLIALGGVGWAWNQSNKAEERVLEKTNENGSNSQQNSRVEKSTTTNSDSSKISSPVSPNSSQVLQDRANQALLDALEEKDVNEVQERLYSFNDAWRENPALNCRNNPTYDYEIAKLVIGSLQNKLIRNYGSSSNWLNGLEFLFKSWCLDKGY